MSQQRRLSDPGTDWSVPDPARLATAIRLRAVQMVAPHGLGYLGQALSCAEVMAALLGKMTPGRDRLVISPSHYVIVAFAAAGELGLLSAAELATYGHDDSTLEAIGTERSPIVDHTCGSLGQGLSAAAGLTLADRMRGNQAQTYAIVSDGELEEGQVWEAALFAAHQKLSHLTVVVDANNSQVDGPVDTITTLDPIAEKWQAFGWRAMEVDGHDVAALGNALHEVGEDPRPAVIIARTSTRHGLACLPPDADGHFIKIDAELAAAAEAELLARLAVQL